jgi:DNA replication and repair protein RecF
MAHLTQLSLHQFRCFQDSKFEFSPRINCISGANGSGKTSILEGIFFLAYGKSFRAKELNRLIHQGARCFTLNAQGPDLNIGMQRSTQESINRLNGETIKTLSPFAEALPLILLHPESFSLLTGSARHRRYLIDWGVFYHHPEAHPYFALMRKAIKQRNQALKQRAIRQHIRLWESTCHDACLAITKLRCQYIDRLERLLMQLLGPAFVERHHLELHYDQGWDAQYSLSEAWENTFQQDLRFGYTHAGPHQADLKITAHKKPAKDRLSRGEQKLVISMLKLAQGLLLTTQKQIEPLYLFDDLASELDLTHREKIAEHLAQGQAQIFISSIEEQALFDGHAQQIMLLEKNKNT